jgi:hypothetical protein
MNGRSTTAIVAELVLVARCATTSTTFTVTLPQRHRQEKREKREKKFKDDMNTVTVNDLALGKPYRSVLPTTAVSYPSPI